LSQFNFSIMQLLSL
jgi:hypothetical protein